MSLSATLTIDVSMIAMISPSMTVRVIIASGGFALRSALRSTAVMGRARPPGAATDALTKRRSSLVPLSILPP